LRLGTYEPLRNFIAPSDSQPSFLVKFIAGGLAGFLGSTFSAPADILKVRMQAFEGRNPPSLLWHF
jgi:hypothetical protein